MRPLTHYHKFYVLRYNARGVGLSSGWKSLTGLQEADDLRELVKCALKRLSDVHEVALIVSVHLIPFSCLPRALWSYWSTNTTQTFPSPKTGILEWSTDRVDAPCATSSPTHHTHPDILPAWTTRASHCLSNTNVSARPRGTRAATRGSGTIMPGRCG